jgi:hypothetical protein
VRDDTVELLCFSGYTLEKFGQCQFVWLTMIFVQLSWVEDYDIVFTLWVCS